MNPNDRRIREEIDHHLEELQAQLTEQGMTTEEAASEAARRFGDTAHIEREARDVNARAGRLVSVFDRVRRDLAFATRQLVRQPLVSGLTLATLVVGVAATAIVYSVVHAVVLAPLPFSEPQELVHVTQLSPQGRRYSISEPNFVDFRARQRSFVEMAALGFANPVLRTEEATEAVEAMTVSQTFFPLLGISPVLGRNFEPAEDVFGGATDVVLLSRGTWMRRFGGDERVVGQTIQLDGRAHQVVGIVPSETAWPGVELFTPLAPNPDQYRDDQRIEAIGRLLPGVSMEAAQADVSDIAAQLSVEYPASNDRWGGLAEPARDWLVGARLTRLGGFLLGAVALFLLMACASVSNLLLARATTRIEEMSVRAALGAGRARIASQLVTEGALLAAVGAVLAVVLAKGGLTLVQTLGPADVARLEDAAVGGPVLAVAVAAAVLTVLVAGLAPAFLLTRGELFASLRSGARGSTDPSPRLRSGLVVAQFALAVTVLLSASLLTRSFVRLQEVDLGFEPAGMVTFNVRLTGDRFGLEERDLYLRELALELEAIPGIEAVGATHAAPYGRWRPSNFVARSDQEPDRQEDFVPVSWRGVSGDYFQATGIPLLEGRLFGSEDVLWGGQDFANPPVIIDETLAEILFPDQSAVGRLVTWFLPGGRQCEIVGVVASARDERMDLEARPRIYRPFSFTGWDQPSVVVRTAADAAALIPAIRSAVIGLDADVPAIAPTLVEQRMSASVAWPRFSMQVLFVFGLIALGLAAMGIYGVTAFSVTRRQREIGVRVALGAEPSIVMWMVVKSAMRLAVVGILVGLVASFGITGLLQAQLYDLSAKDPVTFGLVPLVLGVVAVASAWLPARRVIGLDPKKALVSE